jgi:hypothetical protein
MVPDRVAAELQPGGILLFTFSHYISSFMIKIHYDINQYDIA